MLKYLLLLFVATYIGSIIFYISQISQINNCITVLSEFLKSGRFSSYGELIQNENFVPCLNRLLSIYPKISKFSDMYDPPLSYGDDPLTTYTAAYKLYNSLFMRKNFLVNDLRDSFNPINTLKKMAILPSTLLTFFGFQPGVYSSRIFNLIGWILTYLLGLYQNEIKLFISSLLKLT